MERVCVPKVRVTQVGSIWAVRSRAIGALLVVAVAAALLITACGQGADGRPTASPIPRRSTPTDVVQVTPTRVLATPSPTPLVIIVPSPVSGTTPTRPTATITAATTGETIYTVKAGDTLSEISANFGVTIDAIVKTNDLKDRDKLQIGQKLKIPPR